MTLSLFLFYFLQVSHFFHFISPFYNNFYSHNSIVSMFISVLILFPFTSSFFFPQHRKYVQRGFGECPRMLCRGQPVLPVSTDSDICMNMNMNILYIIFYLVLSLFHTFWLCMIQQLTGFSENGPSSVQIIITEYKYRSSKPKKREQGYHPHLQGDFFRF